MRRLLLFVLAVAFIQTSVIAQEGEGGMWMPNTIKQVEKDMQKMGMKISAEDIWNNDSPSIKDAIVQLGNGCTAEIMSDKSLVFTNHHCGYDAIQSLSTIENNYLENGYWANSFTEELPAEGLTVTFIDDIEDVSEIILNGVTPELKTEERQSVIDKNINQLNKATPQDRFHSIEIKPFFKGNKYFMIKKTTFYDIRLVGTPPASLGKFGGDTDNWMWPRHTADFSVFRVYADANNNPAMYSPDNKPYKPKYSLKINLEDLQEEDFTMVMGFPGRTSEYLTSYAVKLKQDVRNPARVSVRERTLAIMDKNMKNNEALKLKLASKHASLANYWKFWIGESQGLRKFNAVGAKEEFEKEFTKRVNSSRRWSTLYRNLLPRFKELYKQLEPYAVVQDYTSEVFNRNMSLPTVAMITNMLVKRVEENGEAVYPQMKDRFKGYLIENVLKDFDATTDKEIFASLIDLYTSKVDKAYISPELSEALQNKTPQQLAEELYGKTKLASVDALEKLFEAPTFQAFKEQLESDPAYQLFIAQKQWIDQKVSTPANAINAELDVLMGKYMKAQMDLFPEKEFYPDANFTMRVAYGRVKGFTPRDAVFYEPFTHLYGVMEKYIPDDPEFDLPLDIIEAYNKKDYGNYASKDGTLVTDFLATNHITGGNSGSPILNANGEHIGLAFDGNWEGVMMDVYYRPEIARSIHVKDNYVLFIIDKLANCQHIMKELTIVK